MCGQGLGHQHHLPPANGITGTQGSCPSSRNAGEEPAPAHAHSVGASRRAVCHRLISRLQWGRPGPADGHVACRTGRRFGSEAVGAELWSGFLRGTGSRSAHSDRNQVHKGRCRVVGQGSGQRSEPGGHRTFSNVQSSTQDRVPGARLRMSRPAREAEPPNVLESPTPPPAPRPPPPAAREQQAATDSSGEAGLRALLHQHPRVAPPALSVWRGRQGQGRRPLKEGMGGHRTAGPQEGTPGPPPAARARVLSLKLHSPRGDVEHGRVESLASEGRTFSVPPLLQHLMDFLQQKTDREVNPGPARPSRTHTPPPGPAWATEPSTGRAPCRPPTPSVTAKGCRLHVLRALPTRNLSKSKGPRTVAMGPCSPHQPSGLLGMSSQSSQLAAIPGQSPGTLPLPACTGRGHQCPHQLREALPVGPVPRLLVVWWPQQVLLKHERRAQR